MSSEEPKPECFIIMPISDPSGYESGHFERVYRLVFQPACEQAGFASHRSDDRKETDLIHADMLKRIINAPMALCDLSTLNPNVLFELGVRQAFDKPVALVQEKGTDRIFDISLIRVYDYHADMRADHAPLDRDGIAEVLHATYESSRSGEGASSLIRALSLQAASIPNPSDLSESPMIERVLIELQGMRDELQGFTRGRAEWHGGSSVSRRQFGSSIDELRFMVAELETRIANPFHDRDSAIREMAEVQLRLNVAMELLSDPQTTPAREQVNELMALNQKMIRMRGALEREISRGGRVF